LGFVFMILTAFERRQVTLTYYDRFGIKLLSMTL
jgi:hypothetical protein